MGAARASGRTATWRGRDRSDLAVRLERGARGRGVRVPRAAPARRGHVGDARPIQLEPCQVFWVVRACSGGGTGRTWRGGGSRLLVSRDRAQGGEVDADGRRSRCFTCWRNTSRARRSCAGRRPGSQARIVFGIAPADGRAVAVAARAGAAGARQRHHHADGIDQARQREGLDAGRAEPELHRARRSRTRRRSSCTTCSRARRARARIRCCSARRRPATTCSRSATRCARR